MAITNISSAILNISARMGRVEGQMHANSYPTSPIGPKIGTSVKLEEFQGEEKSIQVMRNELDNCYDAIGRISLDVPDVPPAVIEVFKSQMKTLHEKRGMLENTLHAFEDHLRVFSQIQLTGTDVKEMEGVVKRFEEEKWEGTSEEILSRIQISKDFCMAFLRMRRNPADPEHSPKLMDAVKDIMHQFEGFKCRVRMQEHKNNAAFKKLIETLKEHLNQSPVNLEKIKAIFNQLPIAFSRDVFEMADVDFEVEALLKDPEKALTAVETAWEKYLVVKFPKKIDELLRKPVESLRDLKKRVQELIWITTFSDTEKEELARLYIEDVEKHEVDLNSAHGVYYFIWHIAHRKDPSAGGATFGKDNASKDLNRLLNAIDLSIVMTEKASPKTAQPGKVQSKEKQALEDLRSRLQYLCQEQDRVIAEGLALECLGFVESGQIDLNGLYSCIPGGKDNAHRDLERLMNAVRLTLAKLDEEANTIVLPTYTATFATTTPPKPEEPPKVAAAPKSPELPKKVEPPKTVESPKPLLVRTASERPASSPLRKAAEVFQVEAKPAPKSPPPLVTEIRVMARLAANQTLEIRGIGAGLNWNQGKVLQKSEDGTYLFFKFNGTCKDGKYKFVLNGTQWETGDDRPIQEGTVNIIAPNLKLPLAPVKTTRISVPAGPYGGKLFVRGLGGGLSWEKGIEMKLDKGEWVYETTAENFPALIYKLLVDDKKWEQSGDHNVECGKSQKFTPKF